MHERIVVVILFVCLFICHFFKNLSCSLEKEKKQTNKQQLCFESVPSNHTHLASTIGKVSPPLKSSLATVKVKSCHKSCLS